VKLSVWNAGFWIVIVSALGFAAPAAAQTPKAELQLAYQALHVPEDWLTRGVNFDLAFNLNPVVGIVFEVGGASESASESGVSASINATNLGGGMRFSSRSSGKVTPYAQIIVGGVRGQFKLASGGADLNLHAWKFMLQPGAGVNVKVGSAFGIFGAADYRRLFLDEATDGASGENEFRLLAGVRFDF